MPRTLKPTQAFSKAHPLLELSGDHPSHEEVSWVMTQSWGWLRDTAVWAGSRAGHSRQSRAPATWTHSVILSSATSHLSHAFFFSQYNLNHAKASALATRTVLTRVKGAVFLQRDEDVRQAAGAAAGTGRPSLVQPDQLQPRRGGGGKAVELEGEIHSLWPWRSWAVLGHSESNNSSALIRRPQERALTQADSGCGRWGPGHQRSPTPGPRGAGHRALALPAEAHRLGHTAPANTPSVGGFVLLFT